MFFSSFEGVFFVLFGGVFVLFGGVFVLVGCFFFVFRASARLFGVFFFFEGLPHRTGNSRSARRSFI